MFLYFLCLIGLAVAQPSTTLSAVLAARNLTTFKSYLDQYQSFSTQLAGGNVTILAPTNDAFATFLKTATVNQTTPGVILATLQYHVLFGRFPVMSQIQQPLFNPGDPPEFLATLLNNATYANVTGGQRVEILSANNHTVFRSSLKHDSAVISPDIPYQESNGLPGLVQIVDRVLIVPISAILTAKTANLTVGYNVIAQQPRETSQQSVGERWKYVTLFLPNENIPDLTHYTTDYRVHATDYHIYPDELLYSTELTNGLVIQSNQGGNATIRIINGTTYINAAKVIATDYLVYNGVMHVIDRLLNFSLPNELPEPLLNLNGTPPTNPAVAPKSHTDGLPVGAKIGIGLVVGITILGIIGITAYYWRRHTDRGRNEPINELHGQYVLEKVHELPSPGYIPELDVKAQVIAELHASSQAYAELPGKTESSSLLKQRGTKDRHDVIESNAHSRASDEIRRMRKYEQDMIRAENERENTQSPFDKLAKENKSDGGVYRPSDHAPQPTWPLPKSNDVISPTEDNALERVISSESTVMEQEVQSVR